MLSIEENNFVLSVTCAISSPLITNGLDSVDKVMQGICASPSHLVERTSSPLLSLPPVIGEIYIIILICISVCLYRTFSVCFFSPYDHLCTLSINEL